MLGKLHQGHQGIVKCRELAKSSVWWNGLSTQLENLIKSCQKCIEGSQNVREPLIPSKFPDRPWQKVATDLFELDGQKYLLVVDYYSRFIEIAKLFGTTSAAVINHLKSIFGRHGIPEIVFSDNGPQYASQTFREFAGKYYFKHITSSPNYPQSNGLAERSVQTIKQMLKKSDDPYLALLMYRSTPLSNGYSPAELLMNRKIKTNVPINPKQLKPKLPNVKLIQKRELNNKKKQKQNFDRRHRARNLRQLKPGNNVWLKDQKCPGVVKTCLDLPRSYVIKTQEGDVRRNRSHVVDKQQSTETETGQHVAAEL